MRMETEQMARETHDPRCMSLTDSPFNDHCDCNIWAILDRAKMEPLRFPPTVSEQAEEVSRQGRALAEPVAARLRAFVAWLASSPLLTRFRRSTGRTGPDHTNRNDEGDM